MLTRNPLARLNPWQSAVFQQAITPSILETMRPLYSPGSFNKEFGIKVNMGRRAGHTVLAATLLHEATSVVVVPYEQMKDQIAREVGPWMRMGDNDMRRVFNPPELLTGGIPQRPEETVCVVDCASYVDPVDLEKIRSYPWARYVELG